MSEPAGFGDPALQYRNVRSCGARSPNRAAKKPWRAMNARTDKPSFLAGYGDPALQPMNKPHGAQKRNVVPTE